jgi:flagellar protein FliS
MYQIHQNYLENQVLSASPLELVALLYSITIDSVDTARTKIVEGDIRGRGQAISRASEAVIELARSVDREQGGDLARSLIELYDFVLRRLQHAHLHGDDAALAELLPILRTLQDGWNEISRANLQPPHVELAEPIECSF